MDRIKICRLGNYQEWKTEAPRYVCFKWDGVRLSITGVEGPMRNGGCLGACGQIDMHPWEFTSYAPGWDAESVQKLRDIWKRYHLNDRHGVQVPPDVIEWIFSRPDTDRQPTWI